ncbi:MAG: hypothetical protein IMW97_06750 [Firmicutes bacterium]|nr:hypothetical protein [Candidatus Fermentithermobacillaceae bacterium]
MPVEVTIQKTVLAIVTDDPRKASGAPTFVVPDESRRQHVATILSRILQGQVHDLGDGMLIVVRH